ncbi:MAG: flagellar biosynthesis regulator FlaF [Pseudomonadota bacterium]|nr:flagellar biosynthesis regulator FlaF [Pseudomonadota bacterium]
MTTPATLPPRPRPGRPGAGHGSALGAVYGDARDAVLTPRQAEYRVFARATHRLSDASARCAEGDRLAWFKLAEAVHDNLRLWLTLATDLAADGNGLPDALRANLISLAGFVESHSHKVLNKRADAAALIEINAAVMKGLRGGAERD